jgi:hypothetical protein
MIYATPGHLRSASLVHLAETDELGGRGSADAVCEAETKGGGN